jgi:hypothetical protein
MSTALALVPRGAYAEPPNARATPVYVLPISTEDSDDQADALTQALRSRVRQVQGWSLLETNLSFDTLAIALRCPPKPDRQCLARIGDQLKADHYMWGTMTHQKANGEVSAEVHLWSRSKGDEVFTETHSDNLKDASDESLKQIAAKLFGRLSGSAPSGTLIVHAGTGTGRVLVDGVAKGVLESGVARVELGKGTHTVAVRVQGYDAPPQQASIPSGGEQEVTFELALTRTPTPVEAAEPSTPFPVRKVLTYAALVAGGGLLVAGGIETGIWVSDELKIHDDRNKTASNYGTQGASCAVVFYGPDGAPNPVPSSSSAATFASNAQDACRLAKDAPNTATLAWVLGGAGAVLLGTGVVLLLTDHHASEPGHDTGTTAQPKARLDVLPIVGLRGGAIDLRVTF